VRVRTDGQITDTQTAAQRGSQTCFIMYPMLYAVAMGQIVINRNVRCVCFVFAVLLYVREQHEAVFTAILLKTPTLSSLIHAVR